MAPLRSLAYGPLLRRGPAPLPNAATTKQNARVKNISLDDVNQLVHDKKASAAESKYRFNSYRNLYSHHNGIAILITGIRKVVARAGRYAVVRPTSDDPQDPSPLKVKEVWVEGKRRYVVCVNEDQAAKDRHDREAVTAALRDALKRGDKSLVGKKAFASFCVVAARRS